MDTKKEMDEAANLLMVLLHSATIAHVMHWRTTNFAEHKALGKYYEQMPALTDALAESLFGKYSTIDEFPDFFMLEYGALQYMTEIQEYVESQRKLIAQDSEIQNAVDEIMDLLNTTVYKLRQFEE
jgi:DNA-binding ferritin-like protein